MVTREGAHPGRWASIALVAIAFAAALAWAGPAFAVDTSFTINPSQPVDESTCNHCHANVADSKSSEIIFKHAYHVLIPCSSCHTQFPHRPEGTAIPKMKECFNCHGLRHGPQGLLATGECPKCHRSVRTSNTKPDFHKVSDWAGKAHVEPSRHELRTKCMMCHDQKWCDDCHKAKAIAWKPNEPYTYNSAQGCNACHGSVLLQKMSGGQPKSFMITGVDQSAHAKMDCQDCHPDFKYTDGADQTKLWDVNAGLGCRLCHVGLVAKYSSQVATFSKNVAMYDNSIHAQKLIAGNMQSATCSSCHGGHDIKRLNTAANKAELRGAAYRVCARCHLKEYNSYDDYYHGVAYKNGAPDAPSCWNCHGSHAILPHTDTSSTVAPGKNIAATCGKCHEGSQEAFAANAKDLIHKKQATNDANVLAQWIAKMKSWFSFL